MAAYLSRAGCGGQGRVSTVPQAVAVAPTQSRTEAWNKDLPRKHRLPIMGEKTPYYLSGRYIQQLSQQGGFNSRTLCDETPY